MKRDVTVPLSLVMIVVPWIIGAAMGMPSELTGKEPMIFHVFFWIIFAGAIRATVLWFQTLTHGIRYAAEDNRVAVVFGHLFLGPIMSYLYYFYTPVSARADSVGNASARARS
jgi:hypothetical protein